jgi:hypothetical protein
LRRLKLDLTLIFSIFHNYLELDGQSLFVFVSNADSDVNEDSTLKDKARPRIQPRRPRPRPRTQSDLTLKDSVKDYHNNCSWQEQYKKIIYTVFRKKGAL